MIVTLVNQKGGTGKSTLSISLAGEWLRRGRNVVLIDADKQRSAITWAEIAVEANEPTPMTIGMEEKGVMRQVPELEVDHDVIVIDTPGRGGAATQLAALMVAHVALIPTGAEHLDAWALGETLSVVEQAMTVRDAPNPRGPLKAAIVLNQLRRTREAGEARESLEAELPILRTGVGLRTDISRALGAGSIPTSWAPSSSAAFEIRALVDDVEDLVNGEEG